MNSVTYIVKQPQILYVEMEPFSPEVQPPLTKISADGSHVGTVLASPGLPSLFSPKPFFSQKLQEGIFFYSLL